MHTCIPLHGPKRSWCSCPWRVYAGNKNTHSMHYPRRWNVTTSMVGLKKGHIRKSLTPNGEPQLGNTEEEERKNCHNHYHLFHFEHYHLNVSVKVFMHASCYACSESCWWVRLSSLWSSWMPWSVWTCLQISLPRYWKHCCLVLNLIKLDYDLTYILMEKKAWVKRICTLIFTIEKDWCQTWWKKFVISQWNVKVKCW